MDLRVFTEPQQGATFAQLSAVAKRAEHLGFSGFFRSDHYLYIGEGDPRSSVTDAWVTLGGIALETNTLRLGTLMSSATFRFPGPLAVSVAQVDEMSGGRVELGLGAGWYEKEHRAFAIPFPGVAERFDRFEEQLEILDGLWATPAGQSFDYAGAYYQLEKCPVVFRPVQQPHPPLIIGGHGKRRTPQLAARFASEFNMAGPRLQEVAEQFARVDEACRAIGREPGSLMRSVWLTVCIGRDQAEVERRAAAIGRESGDLKERGIAGIPGEARAALDRFASAGVERVYLQFLDLDDLEHLDLVSEVLNSES
jgi:F420-dependent oxidoreductase-like protein